MRRSFPTKEEVYVIDSGDYVGHYIFPNYSAGAKMYQNVDAIIVGGINGNRSPIVKAFKEGNRNSSFKLVNIRRVRGYDTKHTEVPTDIKLKVDEYNSKMAELRKGNLSKDEEDSELFNKVSELNRDLVEYFEK